jgi:hypothetical protein
MVGPALVPAANDLATQARGIALHMWGSAVAGALITVRPARRGAKRP